MKEIIFGFIKIYKLHIISATGLSTFMAAVFLVVLIPVMVTVSAFVVAAVAWIVMTALFNLVAVGFFPITPNDKGDIG